MSKTYTFSECYELLNVDPKTFRKWLDRANIDPERQVSSADNRIRFLTQEQLEMLAQKHGRTLRQGQAQPVELIPASAYKLLMDRVGDLERQVKSLVTDADHQGDRLDTIAEALEKHAHERRTTLVAVSQLEGATAAYNEQAQARAAALERELTQAREQIAAQGEQIAALQSKKRSTTTQAGASAASELGPDLVGALAFTELHHINTGTAKSAWQTGRIAAVRGSWKQGRSTISIALDAQGRAQFYELYSDHRDFQPCPDCPHTAQQPDPQRGEAR